MEIQGGGWNGRRPQARGVSEDKERRQAVGVRRQPGDCRVVVNVLYVFPLFRFPDFVLLGVSPSLLDLSVPLSFWFPDLVASAALHLLSAVESDCEKFLQIHS